MNSGNVFCRLCAEMKPNDNLVDLTCDTEKRNEVIEKLARLNTPTEFIDNKLPSTVCLECIRALNQCFDFVVNIEYAQNVLNDIYLQNVKQEARSDDEASSGASGAVDVNIKAESDDEVRSSVLPKTVKVPDKVKKSNSLDSIPLAQLKQTWAGYSWLCTYCETLFRTIDELLTHSMAVHGSCNPYRCTECKVRKYRLDKFLVHVQRHRQHLKLSCYKCFQQFKTVPLAREHSKVHFDLELSCPGCYSSSKTFEELKQHKDAYLKVKNFRNLSLIGKGLTCTECSKTCKTKSNLYAHLLTHTDRKPEHICEVCGKCFYQKNHLANHILIHSEDRPHKCQICKSAFKTRVLLKRHIGMHNNDKPFSCDQCGRCFRLREQLKSHSIIHTGSFPYECSQCKKKFHFKIGLNNHACMNTGVKPYSCELCQREFAHSTYYRRHMKRKHNQDTSKKKDTLDGWYLLDPSTGQLIDQKKGRPTKADQSSNQSVVESEEVDNSN